MTRLLETERFAHSLVTLLGDRPLTATDQAAVDHEVVAVDEARSVGSEEHRGVGDVVGEAGARDRLQLLQPALHRFGGFLRRFGRQAERLAEDAGGDAAGRYAVDAHLALAEL